MQEKEVRWSLYKSRYNADDYLVSCWKCIKNYIQ